MKPQSHIYDRKECKQIVLITYFIFHLSESSFLNAFCRPWPRNAAVLLFTSHQVQIEFSVCVCTALSHKIKHGSSKTSLRPAGVLQWCWHKEFACAPLRKQTDTTSCNSYIGHYDFPFKITPETAMPIRNRIYHLSEWFNKAATAEENELGGSGSRVCLVLAAVWAFPSVPLMLVVNCNKKGYACSQDI